MGNEHPPLYPFPDDEVLWWRNRNEFDPESDSYFALGKPPEADVRKVGGKEHTNPYRLVVRSPVTGSQSFLVNMGDMVSLIAIGLTAMADDDSGMYGPKDEERVVMNESYWELLTDLSIDMDPNDL